jgi:hypothetical protein
VRQRISIHLIAVLLLASVRCYTADTLNVMDIKENFNIYKYVSILEDSSQRLTIDSVRNNLDNYAFQDIRSSNNLNFQYSTSTYWMKLVLTNTSTVPQEFVFEVSNPDLDHINFYTLSYGSIIKTTETGELHDIKTREVYDRNFLSVLNLMPGKTYVFLISANNGGHPFFVPISLKERTLYERKQKGTELFFWGINGLLFFIIFFNLYLFRITRDRVNLFYTLYVIFASLTLLSYDGYFFYFNPPVIIEKLKWLNPSLYIVFLLSFTQVFTSYTPGFKWQSKFLNPFKVLAVVAVAFYSLRYPFSLVADFGIPLLILASLILIIIISAGALKKGYSPSILLFLGYCSVFIGFLINQLKELNFIPTNFFVENSSKLGQTLECMILTIAVLERFRISQEDSKKTIHDNLVRIEIQNREFEIINTELEKLSIVASETDNSVAIYDNEGRLEWCNTGFEKLYETKINELIKNSRDNIKYIIPNDLVIRSRTYD